MFFCFYLTKYNKLVLKAFHMMASQAIEYIAGQRYEAFGE